MSYYTWFKIGVAITVIGGGLMISQPAAALGDREEGVLIGIGSLLILDEIAERRDVGSFGVWRGNRPTRDFPRFRCSSRDGITCAYERGAWERERELWYQEQARAYRCGRYGECNE
jgi:hypothetical protein